MGRRRGLARRHPVCLRRLERLGRLTPLAVRLGARIEPVGRALPLDAHDLGPEARTLRRLEKKVRECKDIAARKTAGVEIECSQLAKLERLADYQCELEELRGWVWVAHGAVAGY